jgi:hypothetical protein
MPERPTVATHAFTVARGIVELETGFERDNAPDHTRSWQVPVVVKVGLARRVQLNLAPAVVSPAGGGAGAGDMSIGVKYRLAEGLPLVGAFAVLPALKLPLGDAEHGTKTTDVSLLLISNHQFGGAALDVNVGYTRRSGDGTKAPKEATQWTVSGGVPLTGNVGFVVEVFGYPHTEGPAGSRSAVALLAGPTMPIGPHAVIDVGVIFRLRGPQANALYAGVTWNLGGL